MTSSNKVPDNWLTGLQMADDVETVAISALNRVLELVGSEYLQDHVIRRDNIIVLAIDHLENGRVEEALACLKSS